MRLIAAIISGLIFFSPFALCQLNTRLDLEAGYFNIHNPAMTGEENMLMRGEGELSYNYSSGNGSFNSLFRLRPEWSGIDTELRTIKMGAQAGYVYETEIYGLGLTAAAKRNVYNIYQPVISHDLLSLQGEVSFNLPSDIVLHASPGFFRQMISFGKKQVTDLLSFNLSAGKPLYGALTGEGGIYTEFFSVSEKPGRTYLNKENSFPGWKIGPELNFSYSSESILTLQYHFLLLKSGNTLFPSYEQMVRLMAGFMPEDNISVMFLADYYWHNIKVKKEKASEEASILNYSAINYENRILLKIGYDVFEDVEVYLRTGYSMENLLNDDFSEKSWSLMAGISFTK